MRNHYGDHHWFFLIAADAEISDRGMIFDHYRRRQLDRDEFLEKHSDVLSHVSDVMKYASYCVKGRNGISVEAEIDESNLDNAFSEYMVLCSILDTLCAEDLVRMRS